MEALLVRTAVRQIECPCCGYLGPNKKDLPKLYRPWHVRNRASVKAYVESLGIEKVEWLLALYIDNEFNLLAVDTLATGGIADCPAPLGRIYRHGVQLRANAFFLVHNHPSGDPRPSQEDLILTRRIRELSHDLEMPLLEHLIIAGEEMMIL